MRSAEASDAGRLDRLYVQIETRVESVRASRDWPCRRGCDACCRRLAHLPALVPAEWARLERALESLSQSRREQIERRLDSLAECPPSPPITCPFLSVEDGSCLVYTSRPAACRAYGFYIERDRGLYCGEIQRRVDGADYDGVVWGSQVAVERELDELGERIPLLDWRRRRRAAKA